MAGGGFIAAEEGSTRDYGGGLFSVVVTCLMAASCGLIYGYDNGVTGGVTQMESFLSKFFPEVVLSGKKNAKQDAYCKYDNQWLTAFTLSLFIVAPVYLSETAPVKWRGTFTSSYNGFAVFGMLCAAITNYFTNHIPSWGWRISVGLAAIPGAVIFMGAFFVSDTPSSLAMRGHLDGIVLPCSTSVGRTPTLTPSSRTLSMLWTRGTTMTREHSGDYLASSTGTFSCFGVSWAPLRLVVPSEIYPVEVRSAGQAMSISITFFLSFVELQVFIALLCAMKYAVFLFYAAWLLFMTIFVALFLPETKGVPLEVMRSVWARHWYWRRFAKDAKQEVQVNSL
ncbi:Sugar transport protein 5 [Dichanthelium oligosanthes]|uniref:Sugar transport protein 5 n=1 Tax=Dichanthelium oligosanthes TaxID=888268 RepID=A0A1E5VSQ7_9POAL|nr:Sugar transport protein 5 [Dichanthelium oligosanthes]